jgi:hypothetical protein
VFVQTVRHFFPNFNNWLDALPDTRKPQLCVYETRFLGWWGILLYVLQLGSRRQLNFRLDAQGTQVLHNVNRLAGTQQVSRPVDGTLDHYIGHVGPAGFAHLRLQALRHLIRNKVLESARLLGYLVVTLDATGMYYFRQRHCEHCLSQRHGDTTIYLHNVLEAKVLGPSELLFSIGSEFIQNADAGKARSAEAMKQDCERNAFKRLAPRLHQEHPQLRLCLSGDSLYACGPFFQECADHDWAFVVVFKPTVLPTVWADFESLLPLVPEQSLERVLPNGTRQIYRWVNELSYIDSEKRSFTLNGLKCEETVPNKDGTQTTSTFAWLTVLPVNRKTVEAIANQGGRERWKIENQGFNRQKNSGLNLQHLYSTDPDKFQAYYYLMQLACMLLCLLEQGSLLRRLAAEYGRTPWQLFGSLQNLAWQLLESLRCFEWPESCFDAEAASRLRVSFASFDTS